MAGGKRGRGRPIGSGKRWTAFDDMQLWAGVKFICWRDDEVNVVDALGKMINAGWSQYRSGPAEPTTDQLDAAVARDGRDATSYTREERGAIAAEPTTNELAAAAARDGRDPTSYTRTERFAIGNSGALHGARAWLSCSPTDDNRAGPVGRLGTRAGVRTHSSTDVRVLRGRYYAARLRRNTDPEFRRDCDFWLLVRKETYRCGGDAEQGFKRALAKRD